MVEDQNQIGAFIATDYPIESEVTVDNGEISNDITVITQDVTDTFQEKENMKRAHKMENNCKKCISLKKKVLQLQKKISRLRKNNRMLQEKMVKNNYLQDSEQYVSEHSEDKPEECEPEEDQYNVYEDLCGNESDWSSQEEFTADFSQTDEETFPAFTKNTVNVESETDCAEEPKFIVFYSMLVALFSLFCFNCKTENPGVTIKRNGTMATVTQSCQICSPLKSFTWQSQPLIFIKHAAGNVMICFGILMSGVSISKALLLFKHAGLSMICPRTYFNHQREFLLPSILHHWKKNQSDMIKEIQNLDNTTWSGDGRFDSMGHNAKYGAYTMFNNDTSKLIHFELLQSNQTGNSNAMELEGAKRCFEYLKSAGLKIPVFVTDRHKGISKWLREKHKDTLHFHDLWHVCKNLYKELFKASKIKGCEILKDWMKSIKKHLYWCALSSTQGFGGLSVGKWKSILRHVAGNHDNHPDELFTKCAHGELTEDRKWIFTGKHEYFISQIPTLPVL